MVSFDFIGSGLVGEAGESGRVGIPGPQFHLEALITLDDVVSFDFIGSGLVGITLVLCFFERGDDEILGICLNNFSFFIFGGYILSGIRTFLGLSLGFLTTRDLSLGFLTT